ncbi:hypothetical protein AX16_003803 [Volvariella volvacea WC 439]|nr:hypothetical protein AX16_003803 [Volvariella volvacea WC 439]
MNEPLSLFLKLLLVLVNGYSFYLATKPPSVGGEIKRKDIEGGLLAKFMRVMITLQPFQQGGYVLLASLEFLSILSKMAGTQPGLMIPDSKLLSLGNERVFLSPLYLIGTLVLFAGMSLRLWCYRTLNDHFTFAITELKNHKLITAGPYSIVRHPAYLGSLVVRIGAFLTLYCPGTWLRESHVLNSKFLGPLIAVWTLQSGLVGVLLSFRINTEDRMLKGRFGKEWEEYAARVKYKLIPGVF